MQGFWGAQPPEAMGCFVIITPKSYLMHDLEHILSKYKEGFNHIWSRGCGGCNPLEDKMSPSM